MSNEQGRRIDDKRSNESLKREEAQGGNTSLTDALKPFAELAELYDDENRGTTMPKSGPIMQWPRLNKDYALTVEHLRAAREVLSSHPMPAQAAVTEQATESEIRKQFGVAVDTQKDAMRYDWMRKFGYQAHELVFHDDGTLKWGKELDEAIDSALCLAAPADAGAAQAPTAQDREVIEEAAQVLESAAKHNDSKGRTVLAKTQQDRTNRLREVLARLSTPGAPVTAGAGAAAPVSRDAVLDEAAKACESYAEAVRPTYPNDANGALCCARNIRAMKAPPVAAAAGEDARDAGWISVDERLPADGETVLVYVPNCTYQKIWFDTWGMQREAPVSFSSITVEAGQMWSEHAFEEITQWMPLPPTPVESAKQGGSE